MEKDIFLIGIYIVWGLLTLIAFVFATEWGDYSSKKSVLHQGTDVWSIRRWRKATIITLLLSLIPYISHVVHKKSLLLSNRLYLLQISIILIGFMFSKTRPAKRKPPYLVAKK